MRARVPAAVAALVLAATSLAACRTNVGVAARVDGHTFTESNVNDYLTASAKPIQGDTSSIAAPSFVLQYLIEDRLLTKLESTRPLKALTPATIDSTETKALKASGGRAAVIKAVGLGGYTTAFQDLFIKTQVRAILIKEEAGDSQAQVSLGAIAKAIKLTPAKFPVTVSPRYGKWDTTTFSLDSTPVTPDYLKLQPTPAASADGSGPTG